MTNFTPIDSLIGGLLLGLSATLLLISSGRIAGLSGLITSLMPPGNMTRGNLPGLMFLIGLVIALPLYRLFTGSVPEVQTPASIPLLVISGLLIGSGSILGSGCTSGHGICGLSRFSMRSVIATISFMASAIATVYVARHLIGS